VLITRLMNSGASAIADNVDMKKQSPTWPCFTTYRLIVSGSSRHPGAYS